MTNFYIPSPLKSPSVFISRLHTVVDIDNSILYLIRSRISAEFFEILHYINFISSQAYKSSESFK